jgi:alpha-L-fucosidase
MKQIFCAIAFYVLAMSLNAQVKASSPCGPVPSENQLSWQKMEYYAFVHFSLNTPNFSCIF